MFGIDPIELPEGWRVTHLIELAENDWQANLTDDEHVVVKTGFTPRSAIQMACDHARIGHYTGRLSIGVLSTFTGSVQSTLTKLGLLGKRKVMIRRR